LLKHTIIIYWSAEDSAFIAEVPEMPGCTADGKTRQEARDGRIKTSQKHWRTS